MPQVRPHLTKLLLLLLSLDLLFVSLHVLRVLLLPDGSTAYERFSVDEDGGFPEIFQYLKFLFIVGGLLYLSVRRKAPTCGVWASVFAFALLDDALRLHETLGQSVVRALGLVPALGLNAQDFGELIVWGAVGSVAFGALLAAYVRAAPELRCFSRQLFYRFLLLVVFGLGLDLAHSALIRASSSLRGVAVMEDGGEMLAVSLIVAFVWSAVKEVRMSAQQRQQSAEPVRKTAV